MLLDITHYEKQSFPTTIDKPGYCQSPATVKRTENDSSPQQEKPYQGKPFQFPSYGYMREHYEWLIRELQEKINEIDKYGDGGNAPKG